MKKFTILGGDQRSIKLANLLKKDGYEVLVFGFDKVTENLNLNESTSLHDAIKSSDVIIGSLPFTDEEDNLYAPLYNGRISVHEVFNKISNQLLIAGKVNKQYITLGESRNIQLIDYFKREEMQVLNAIPTAEGAIQIAMEHMPITINNSNAIVLGFGRTGKILARMLYGIGANTFVSARKCSDIAWIKGYGYNPVYFKDLKEKLPEMDVIFNTIPDIVLKEELLNSINNNSIIIDIASKPGGVDFEKAAEVGIKAIQALGLPGKVAPVTAAMVIKETIYNIIEEWRNDNGL